MKRTKIAIAVVVTTGSLWAMGGTASAHPHSVNGQHLANDQNHEAYTPEGESCGGDPAAYGLETAHHGPDQAPGKGDGCYETDVHPVYVEGVITKYVPDVNTSPAFD